MRELTYPFEQLPACLVEGRATAFFFGAATVRYRTDGSWDMMTIYLDPADGGKLDVAVPLCKDDNRWLWLDLIAALDRAGDLQEKIYLKLAEEGIFPDLNAGLALGTAELGVGRYSGHGWA